MIRRIFLMAILAAISGPAVQALPAQVARPDAATLRGRIETQFMARVRQQLGLDDAQSQQLLKVLKSSADARRNLESTERDLKAVLREQLRPGVAADTTAIDRALDQLLANRVHYAETFRSEMTELRTILTPVQRAQYFQLREQLMQRIQQIIQDRRPAAATGRRRP